MCLLCLQLKNIMICGIDTYHDSSKKGRSVGAFVASINKSCTRYFSKVSFQMNHQELMDNLKVSFTGEASLSHFCSLSFIVHKTVDVIA